MATDDDNEPVEYFTVTLSDPTANADRIPNATYGSPRRFRIKASDPLSMDAALRSLIISDVTNWDPAFNASTLNYRVNAANNITQVTVTATANHAGATVAITPADVDTGTAGHQVNLSEGDNTITIVVTAADSSTMTYTVVVRRAGGANTLSSLTITGSDGNRYDLSPDFAPSTEDYTVTVPRVNESVTVAMELTATGPSLSITVVGTSTVQHPLGANRSYPVTLGAAGSVTNINLLVAATQASGGNKTYSVAVTRDTTTDYDDDNDGLIDIRTLAQLNAVRYDLDGDGIPTNRRTLASQGVGGDTSATIRAAYRGNSGAFPYPPTTGMGCPDTGCIGYELRADLDFDTGTAGDRTDDTYWDGGKGWLPIGQRKLHNSDYRHAPQPDANIPPYTAVFQGNGHTISNLYIDDPSGSQGMGLFSYLGQDTATGGARVESLGLINVYVRGNGDVGGLAGKVVSNLENAPQSLTYSNDSRVIGSYVTGTVLGVSRVGGLVGANFGLISASYSRAAVTGSSGSIGGLVGQNGGIIYNSYAAGPVNTTATTERYIGGLNGQSTLGGGSNPFNDSSVRNSYWDFNTGCEHIRNLDGAATYGVGKTTAQLTTPTGYSGIYANWSALYTAHETSTAGANPWSFQAGKHPALNYGGHDASEQFMAQRIDYDCDNDGLIEISNLEQLNAIRWDLNSNSSVDTGFGSDERSKYAAAFPLPVGDSMAAGCGLADHDNDADTAEQAVCHGYELGAEGRSSGLDFDFDTNGNGSADSGDTYWNSGAGWTPIGSAGTGNYWTGLFNGNGHELENLHINSTATVNTGLFGVVGPGGRLEGVALVNASVTSTMGSTGALAGALDGTAADPAVARTSYSTGSVSGAQSVGGLVGSLYTVSALSASYSLASVSGTSNVGGLVGSAGAATTSITASYAYGVVTRTSGTATTVGGLLGNAVSGATITNSYYDNEAGGVGDAGGGGVAKTRRALQEPTAYGATTTTPPSIYANWNLDVDETTGADDPWAFGNADQFPVLKAHGQDTAAQFRLQPALSGVASLTALSIPGVTLAPAFANTEKTYTGTLTDASVGYLTVSGTTSVSVADVVVTPADARASEAGHQVQLNAGSNTITVTVRAQNCTPQSCTQDGPYTITVDLTAQDYDDNENGLIDIRNLAQLNAIRWDLDGNGVADASANNDDYAAAFGRPQPGMGCPESDHDDNSVTPDEPVCVGYELRANLDFDTGTANDRTDDAYYNGGAGWTPIGGVVTTGHPTSYDTIFSGSISPTAYSGRFNGNGHTISNLSIVRTAGEDALGLFGAISGHIEQVGLVNPSVVANSGSALGSLVGYAKSTATITASYAQGGQSGQVRGDGWIGGLVGYNKGSHHRQLRRCGGARGNSPSRGNMRRNRRSGLSADWLAPTRVPSLTATPSGNRSLPSTTGPTQGISVG